MRRVLQRSLIRLVTTPASPPASPLVSQLSIAPREPTSSLRLRLTALVLGALALAGCGGGADTTRNPGSDSGGTGGGPSGYTGEPARTDDIQSFRVEFWENVRGSNRCGNCHGITGTAQSPTFARSDNVNTAYEQISPYIDRENPAQSPLVLKVGGGHNCWLADAGSCAGILTRWITAWVGATATGGRQIQLEEPELKNPGSSRRFPAMAAEAGFGPLYGKLTTHCAACHRSEAATPQSPYFAASNIEEAYQNAIPKINLEQPAESRFVIRLGRESHNCWGDCASNAAEIQALIQTMANGITASPVDPSLVLSKALKLTDGTIASGGNRYEKNMIALYEFKTGHGATAFDTSGVDPAADLTLAGSAGTDYEWFGGYGLTFKSATAKAQASTVTSRKFQQLIGATGEYSVEAWVVPGNVVQEDARIVTYSGSATSRNFSMGQTQYNYDFFGRSNVTDANGAPRFSTADAEQRLQASLQHVVMTFDPLNGRRIYVNGEFTGGSDPQGGGTLGDWDNSFAFAIGNEVSNNRPWAGVVRLVAIHNRALTLDQVKQNFEAGVGEKYFMLFSVSHLVDVPKAYVLFEVTQYDSHGYLFNAPRFISLDAAAQPNNIALKGMRIGINAAEPSVGQAYRLLDTTIDAANYTVDNGQRLSSVGTIIGLENGPSGDEFYLCFDQLGSHSNVCSSYADAVPPTLVGVPRPSDIGVRTFDGINATMAAITGISANDPSVKQTFEKVRESLPAVPDINAFLSSHQTAIAQLAISYCSALIDDTAARVSYFPGLNFTADITTQRNALLNPLIRRAIGNAATQPADADVRTQLDNLITGLCAGGRCASGTRTPIVAKAVCGAAVGNAAMLVR